MPFLRRSRGRRGPRSRNLPLEAEKPSRMAAISGLFRHNVVSIARRGATLEKQFRFEDLFGATRFLGAALKTFSEGETSSERAVFFLVAIFPCPRETFFEGGPFPRPSRNFL